jgi:hypothetical protein
VTLDQAISALRETALMMRDELKWVSSSEGNALLIFAQGNFAWRVVDERCATRVLNAKGPLLQELATLATPAPTGLLVQLIT